MYRAFIEDPNEFPVLVSTVSPRNENLPERPTGVSTDSASTSQNLLLTRSHKDCRQKIIVEKEVWSCDSDDSGTFIHPLQRTRPVKPLKPTPHPTDLPAIHPTSRLPANEQFGLKGLLGKLNKDYADKTLMGQGDDFSSLGLDLNSEHELFPLFNTPWTDSIEKKNILVEPGHYNPMCYYEVEAFPPPHERMGSFGDETLFYAFYTKPQTRIQMAAAKELQRRNWVYCKSIGFWMRNIAENTPIRRSHPTDVFEYGKFIFFEPSLWQKMERECTFLWDNLEEY